MFARKGNYGIRKFDVFNKTDKKALSQSSFGGLITWVAFFCLAILFANEFSSYMTTTTNEVISVDHSKENRMKVLLDIGFPALSCSSVVLEVFDQMNNSPNWDAQFIYRLPYDPARPEEYYCKSWPRTTDFDTTRNCVCRELQEKIASYEPWRGEAVSCGPVPQTEPKGCRIVASLQLFKMKGTIQFSGKVDMVRLFEQLDTAEKGHTDYSHNIHALAFGEQYKDMVNPLTDWKQSHSGPVRQVYFIQLVPTLYVDSKTNPLLTNQYSVTNHTQPLARDSFEPEGIYFSWEISPMLVSMTRQSKTFSHFLTRLCAITGGAWVVLGLVYSLVANTLGQFTEK